MVYAVCIGVMCLLGCTSVSKSSQVAAQTVQKASARLLNAREEHVGTAYLEEGGDGVRIFITVSGLSPGEHGFHIHEVGKCDPPDFQSAGAHFNPVHKEHGWDNPKGHHAGDLPNLTVGADGHATLDWMIRGITLNADSPHSLLHPGGTSLVIHAQADDYRTDPAGGAGARVICGVIRPQLLD